MIISLTGAPGAGKSTLIRSLMEGFLKESEAIMLRVPNLIKKKEQIIQYLMQDEIERIETLAEASDDCRSQGKLSPLELDKILFHVAERCAEDKKIVLLDGAPRGMEQAQFYSRRKKLMDETIFIHLMFPKEAFEQSVSRQFSREAGYFGVEAATKNKQRFINKFHTYETTTKAGLNYLKGLSVPINEIDANLPKEIVGEKAENFLIENISKGAQNEPQYY